jgi:hypothetical protein
MYNKNKLSIYISSKLWVLLPWLLFSILKIENVNFIANIYCEISFFISLYLITSLLYYFLSYESFIIQDDSIDNYFLITFSQKIKIVLLDNSNIILKCNGINPEDEDSESFIAVYNYTKQKFERTYLIHG